MASPERLRDLRSLKVTKIDPTMAWDVPYLSVHRLLQETWAPPYVCMGDRGPKLLETEQITGCEGHELDTLLSH